MPARLFPSTATPNDDWAPSEYTPLVWKKV